ncbi:MAG: aspartate ammonia-lyase [Sinorhizobium meliloti]|uniref:aspartate ammonia-lyase n=1 Tax=Ensifer sesbaniae TaxID=1214071 RepID=UPI001569BEE7|nr:aspartate ammonia-lyase [Ensifer sesbaniae]MCG5486919.1 aspartate ammonia-lyase [Sinorhizobium meliloti]NRQ19104.1 Aspartate ammonia-lyase [Ensifer sesbaniae]
MPNTRTDADSLGSRVLPAGALYGVATLRGQENFDISFHKLGDAPELLKALARIKHAAAAANRDIGVLPAEIANAIIAASVEVESGRHADQFIVDLLEGSGGTSINMNVNEVIANRALQILNEQPGTYSRIHPNDHVNTGQSTNDVLPAAVKLAVYDKSQSLIEALTHLADALQERSIAFGDVLRIGRTCMQAAQPMRLGQAFGGYAAAIRRLVEKLVSARDEMLVLPLGGTAIGTGLGSAPGYRSAVYRHLKEIVGADVRPGANMFDAMQNADAFARVSSEIRISAEVIGKIASDLILLASGLNSGVGELRLPSVQPGSSIMPGKINPVLPMMMQQVAFAVVGNDAGVSLASRQGQLEINHFEPIIASRLFDSIELLAKSTRIFADKCIAGIEADREQSLRNLMQSSALATVLVPKLGYAEVSKLVQASAAERRPFMQVAIERGLLTQDEVLEVVRESTDHREEIA